MAILLDAGAFVNVQQNNGETALMKVNASLGALPTPPHTLPRGSMFSTGPPTTTVLGLVVNQDKTVCGFEGVAAK